VTRPTAAKANVHLLTFVIMFPPRVLLCFMRFVWQAKFIACSHRTVQLQAFLSKFSRL
jgi:hypothetical protein